MFSVHGEAPAQSIGHALFGAIDEIEIEPAHPSDRDIWVPERAGLRRVPIDAIERIEAARDYALLHTASRSHILRITMAALEARLAGSALIRVHRSAFVRPSRVVALRRRGRAYVLALACGTEVPVGPRYLAAVERAIGIAASRG